MTESAEQLLPMDRARRIALEVTHKGLVQTVHTEKALKDLMELLIKQRLYMLTDVEAVRSLWDSFRRNRDLTDLVLSATAELRLRLSYTKPDWTLLINALAEAYSSVPTAARPGLCVLDDDIMHGTPPQDHLRDLLVANPWLVYLLLLSTISPNFLTVKN